MKGFLIDTNVISELRKKERANKGVLEWFESVESGDLYLSVLVIGELIHGVALIQRRDPISAQHLNGWLRQLKREFFDRILPIDHETVELWGELGIEQPVPPVDGLLASTAIQHDLTLVSRNIAHIAGTPATVLNPFTP